NFVGTNSTGRAGLGNGLSGITVQRAAGNTFSGNVLSGNGISAQTGAGLILFGAGSTNNIVRANFIGTDATGTVAIPNSADGIFITGANNTIGGPNPGDGNLISGNLGHGVHFSGTVGVTVPGTGGTGNLLLRNRIGTVANGNAPLPNQGDGVLLAD